VGRYAAAGLLPYVLVAPEAGLEPPLLGRSEGGLELLLPPPPAAAATVQLLLGRQAASKRQLRVLGGKREAWDSGPLETALREAEEESLGLLGASKLRRELLGPVLWWPAGRFALYLYPAPPSLVGALPKSFQARMQGMGEVDVGRVEVSELGWYPYNSLLRASSIRTVGVAPFTRNLLLSQPLLRFLTTIKPG
jgi:hypothetical protein